MPFGYFHRMALSAQASDILLSATRLEITGMLIPNFDPTVAPQVLAQTVNDVLSALLSNSAAWAVAGSDAGVSNFLASAALVPVWLAPLTMFFAVGFAAQMVDGALGMAYGITSSTLLLGLGVPPQAISAGVHAAEVFTTGASGISHYYVGNVDTKLVWNLALPGVGGGLLGALLLSYVELAWIKPFVAIYLFGIGAVILLRAVRFRVVKARAVGTKRLGLVAGFLDAVGGGGWGTLTSGRLIATDLEPRIAIGSVNAAEFFVTVAIAIVLLHKLEMTHWVWLTGLVLGGVVAAPIAARLTKSIPRRAALWVVGVLICGLSLINIGQSI